MCLAPVGQGAPPPSGGWDLIWEESFDAADAAFDARWDMGTHTFDGNEAQFSPDNIEVSGGLMTLRLTAEPTGTKPYRGAELRTDNTTGFFTYGRFETRMKAATGSGIISSFFTFRYDPWQEIDIEFRGRDANAMQANIFYNGGAEGDPNNAPFEVPPFPEDALLPYDAAEEFHVYAFEWDPGVIRWYIDDVLVLESTDPAQVPDLPQQLMMNLWLTDNAWAGPIDPAAVPAQAQYDWVRVYQRASSGLVFDSFDDGDVSDVFTFSETSGGVGVGPTDGASGDPNTALSVGIDPALAGAFAGVVITGGAGTVDASGAAALAFELRPTTVSAGNLPMTLEINLHEDLDGNNVYDGATEDEYQATIEMPLGGGYQTVVIPLSAFTDDNSVFPGADDGFDYTKVMEVVVAIGGLTGPAFQFAMDEVRFTPVLLVDTALDTASDASSVADCTDGVSDGDCSLREAIEVANADPTLDDIRFDVPGGLAVLTLNDVLPGIADPGVSIDGSTQPGASCDAGGGVPGLQVVLDGALLPPGFNDVLSTAVGADGVWIRGLSVVSGPAAGVSLRGADNRVDCSLIGLFPDGTPAGNGREGLYVGVEATNAQIGQPGFRTVVSDNGFQGIVINATGTKVHDTWVGLGLDGVTGHGNTLDGILVGANANFVFVGGPDGQRSVVSGNGENGVNVAGGGNGVTVNNAYIGVGADGMTPVGNAFHGVRFADAPAFARVGNVDLGNVIAGNGFSGLIIEGTGTDNGQVFGNLIGLGADGATAVPNGIDGITVTGGPTNVRIGANQDQSIVAPNVVSGNLRDGIRIDTDASAYVAHNLVGLGADGSAPLGNGAEGIHVIGGSGTVIGGVEAGNVSSSNASNGIRVTGGAAGIEILGNTLGLDAAGLLDRGNGVHGIRVEGGAEATLIGRADLPGSGNLIAGNANNGIDARGAGVGTVVVRNTVGLNAAGDGERNGNSGVTIISTPEVTVGGIGVGNTIGSNGQTGVYVRSASTVGIFGNTIGLAPDGVTPRGNGFSGIILDNVAGAVVGQPGAGNVIASSTDRGVYVLDGTAGVRIQANLIGLAADGTTPRGNGAAGIEISDGVDVLVGSDLDGVDDGLEGNQIAYNADGVLVLAPTGAGHRLVGNAIHDNVGLGIDLGGDGVTANDPDDPDTGANGLQNHPVVTDASVDDGVDFALDSTPSTAFRVELFASAAADPSGYGEGERFVGATTVTTDASGDAVGSFPGAGLLDGEVVALTATPITGPEDLGGTSEFSAAAFLGPPYAVSGPAALGAYAHGSTLNVVWSTLDPALEAGPVRVSVLCPGNAPFVRYASTPNDGQAGFTVPASLGTHGGVDDQASGCAVEVASVADPSRAAESAPFTVRPAGVAGVTTRRLDLATGFRPARYGLQDVIKWFWDETSIPTGTVRLSLVCDGRDRFVRYPDTPNDGQASATLPALFGAYEVCRTEAVSLDDPTRFGRSAPFPILDTPLPSVDVLSPAPGGAIAMGADLDITWETVAIDPSAPVRILLVDLTNGPPNRLIAQTTNTGSYTWPVPTDLDPHAEYRLSVKAIPDGEPAVTTLVDPLTFSSPMSLAAAASSSAEEAPPEVLSVGASRPNPTRSRATVRVGLPEAGPVEVAVYDAVGRRVAVLASGERSAGWHDLAVEAGDLAPGVYVVRAVTSGTVATRTLSVVR
ncbi:hypothetical protein B1759_13750 [Rubrivirga sp. SAORIC476]|nr:hypothetical protein B1759_13750 [Rubrivirga sp. SAORIC476]